MRLLFDTNVVLDVLLNREPFVKEASALFARIELGELNGLLGATTITTIHYLCAKALGAGNAKRHLRQLLTLFSVAPVTEPILTEALDAGFEDYEDAVLYQAAKVAGANGIVTRNPKDFKRATLPIYSPAQALALLAG